MEQSKINDFHEHKIEWSDEKISRLWDYYSRTPPYSDVYFSKVHGRSILRRTELPLKEPLEILDFGCGPAVAILMSVHGGANVIHLDEALASIRAQTYSNLRFYIYCDGPLPRAHEDVLSRHLGTKCTRNHIVRCDRPYGLPAGLNVLIDRALADADITFLARMDADDISLPDRIARQVEFLQQHSNVSLLGTWCIEFTEPGVPLFYKKMPTDEVAVKKFMLFRSPLVHPTVMFRRSVFEHGHRYDVTLSMMQDYELWSRLVLAGHRISNIPEFLLWYRMADGFFSRRTGSRRARTEVLMRIQYARRAGLFQPMYYLKYAAFYLVRISPVWIKRLSYKYLR